MADTDWNDLGESVQRMSRRFELATEIAKSTYASDDLEIVESVLASGGWFVESVDGGYWVEARVWVPADAVEERMEESNDAA